MTDTKESESGARCKVIPIHRPGGRVRFGVEEGPTGTGFPAAPFPELLAIDRALLNFARDTLGMGQPIVHERFVERPHPAGPIYYLVEEGARPDPPAPGLVWRDAGEVAGRVDPADRLALARAVGYLSGQRFGG